MKIRHFLMEDWLLEHRGQVRFNLAESGVTDITLGQLLQLSGLKAEQLSDILLADADTRGSIELRCAVAKLYPGVGPADVLITTGSSEGLWTYFNTMLNPGDRVVVARPAFQSLYEVPRAIGAQVEFFDIFQEDTLPAVERLTRTKTRLVVINTPHNPSGRTLTSGQLDELCALAGARGFELLFDEHYRFLPAAHWPDKLTPSGALRTPAAAATGSLVKCFGLMGLRVGWLIAAPSVLSECRYYKDYLTHTTSPLSDFLATAALRNRNQILAISQQIIGQNRQELDRFLASNPELIEDYRPDGGVVTFLRLQNTDRSCSDFCADLIRTQGVFLLPGASFEYPGYLRMGLGIGPEKFTSALQAIETFLK